MTYTLPVRRMFPGPAPAPARALARRLRGIMGSFAVVLLTVAAPRIRAQATPTATKEPAQVGAAFSFGSPDYTTTYIKGFTVYGDYPLFRRLSAEGEYHDLMIFTPNDIGESSLLGGLRYSFSLEGRATLYAKAMAGIGRFAYQANTYPNPHTDTYGAFAFGGGIEFRAAKRINVRAIDLEYQMWPGYPPNGISPWVATMGAAYYF